MKENALILVYCLAVACFGCKQESSSVEAVQPPTEQSTSSTVAVLIEQLVSPVPAKYPTGKWSGLTIEESFNGYIHPQVEKAREQLVALGTAIYPVLAEHTYDDRYSYSGVYAAWVNNSVGTMITDIMAEGIEPHVGGYKGRENPTGNNGHPSFGEMVRELGGFEKYGAHAKGRSKGELREDYIQWHIAKERSYGFVDAEQEKKVIGNYLRLLEKQ